MSSPTSQPELAENPPTPRKKDSDPSFSPPLAKAQPAKPPRNPRVGWILVAGALSLGGVSLGLFVRARLLINHVALSSTPKLVSVIKAASAPFRPSHRYIGSLEPWVVAKVGPQYVSAYVSTVLVRPGDQLKAGQVLATLDCRSSSAASKAVEASAKSLAQRQVALSHQVQRMRQMMAGGFASANEVEQMTAKSSSEAAELESLRASLSAKALEVDDCIQRAPFDGEVTERHVDPGAYVRPGNPIVTMLDRRTIRVAASAPESDFNDVAPGTAVDIEIEAAGKKLTAPVSRRAPGADAATRTVDFEIDIPNDKHTLPALATALLYIKVGTPQPASRIPSVAASLRGHNATFYVVEDGVAHLKTSAVVGEAAGQLYLDPGALPAGALVVTEGRALLENNDRVSAKEVGP